MDKIIVTVTNPRKSFFYDIELPKQVAIEKLHKDIVESLNRYNSNLFIDINKTKLHCNRINRVLVNEETIETAGVWNGDYITIVGV